MQGDELPGQVWQHHCGGVGAGDHHGLVLQGRDDLAGPGGVPPAPVLLEPGVDPCLARSLQVGWGGPGGDGLQDGVVLQPGPQHLLEGGVDLGVQAPDPVSALVDLAGQVQVETSQHAQRCGVLVRGVDGSQGVGHAPGRAGDDGRVLGVGLGAARCQVGDASHRQSGQVAHGDAHVLSHRHGQGPDGGGLIDHHQHLPICLQALVDLTQALLVVGQGLAEDLPPVPVQGRGPVLAPYRRPVPMKTSMSSISISPAASRCMGEGQPVDKPAPAPTPAKDLTHSGPFPLSAVTSARLPQVTFAPGSSADRGKTPVPTAAGPAPDHPGPPTRQRGRECPSCMRS